MNCGSPQGHGLLLTGSDGLIIPSVGITLVYHHSKIHDSHFSHCHYFVRLQIVTDTAGM